MSKTRDEILAALDADIPRSVIEQREGGGAKKLSYLPGWHVINEMNKIFGPDGWSYDVTELRCVHSGEIVGKYGPLQSASYVATVQLFVQFPDTGSAKRLTDVGFGNGTDKSDPGKPHELATKEAVTDAIKRCAKSLGMSLGLGLYTKTDDYIEDAPQKTPQQSAQIAAPAQPEGSNREALNKRITAMSGVILAKAGRTEKNGGTPEEVAARAAKLAELKADMKTKYMTDVTTALTDADAKYLLETLEKLANGN